MTLPLNMLAVAQAMPGEAGIPAAGNIRLVSVRQIMNGIQPAASANLLQYWVFVPVRRRVVLSDRFLITTAAVRIALSAARRQSGLLFISAAAAISAVMR